MDQAATVALDAAPGAEVVVTNAISPYGHDNADALGVPSAEALLQPADPSTSYPPMIFSGRDLGGLGNRVVGRIAARVPTPTTLPARECAPSWSFPRRAASPVGVGDVCTGCRFTTGSARPSYRAPTTGPPTSPRRILVGAGDGQAARRR